MNITFLLDEDTLHETEAEQAPLIGEYLELENGGEAAGYVVTDRHWAYLANSTNVDIYLRQYVEGEDTEDEAEQA